MSVERRGSTVHLGGRCGIEDVEPLLEALGSGATAIDLTGCEHLHAGVLQLCMAARPEILGEPSSFLRQWIVPLVKSL